MKQIGKTRLISQGSRVSLRARIYHKGESLYLDYRVNGKRRYEFLKLYLGSPKNRIERDNYKETIRMAESIRAKREIELNAGEHDIANSLKRKADFISYFRDFIDNYQKRDYRLLEGTLTHLIKFLKRDSIACFEINEELLQKFRNYLDKNFNGETPFNYFKKLKKVFKQAVKDGYFLKNPAVDIVNRKTEGVKKEILFIEEIQKLADTPCSHLTLKRAALFCCLTGLRYCDVKILKWENIQNDRIRIVQLKTGKEAVINLNASAKKLLGGRGKPDDLVFGLPTPHTCQKVIDRWVKNSGIEKYITWHCFRHSFATNLIIHGADVRSASELLGHSSLNETQKYVHLVEKLKERAVDNLPEITFQ